MRILEKFGFKFTKNLGKSNQNLPKSAKNQANLVPLSANQLSNQSANPRPYQNFIILPIILMAIYALVFFAMRAGISVFAFEDFSALKGDFVKIYASGFALDMSDFAIGASLFVLLGYVSGALYSLSLSLSRYDFVK